MSTFRDELWQAIHPLDHMASVRVVELFDAALAAERAAVIEACASIIERSPTWNKHRGGPLCHCGLCAYVRGNATEIRALPHDCSALDAVVEKARAEQAEEIIAAFDKQISRDLQWREWSKADEHYPFGDGCACGWKPNLLTGPQNWQQWKEHIGSAIDKARAEQKERDYMTARGDPGLPSQSHLQAYWKGRADAANAIRAQE
jgi:hypothetical protein